MATPGVGQDIEDICTRCGDTWHVVVAKVGERVIKVLCKLCGGQHNYRGEKTEGGAAGSTTSSWGASRKRRTTGKRGAAAEPPPPPTFDPSKPPRAYSPQGTYLAGERIVHPNFGTGVVASTPGPGKVDVVFPTGARTLACAKAVSTLERHTKAANVPIADRPPEREGREDDASAPTTPPEKSSHHN
jgi:hypothetical protein